jgi:hypothetical protein
LVSFAKIFFIDTYLCVIMGMVVVLFQITFMIPTSYCG